MRFKTLKHDFQHYHKSFSENFFGNPGLSADYFSENLKCVLMCFKTLKNDFQHYPKPFYENFFGTPDCPGLSADCPQTVCGLFLMNGQICFNTL